MILLQGRGAYLTGVLISGLLDKTAGFRKSWPTRRAALHPSCILPAALAKISRDDGKKAYSKLTGLIGALANGHNSASSTCTWGGDPACNSWHRRDGPSDGAVWRCIYTCSNINKQ